MSAAAQSMAPKNQSDQSVWSALNLAWELGYLIALPAAGFSFGGAYLDNMYGTSPWLLLLGITLALTVSTITVVRKVRALSK